MDSTSRDFSARFEITLGIPRLSAPRSRVGAMSRLARLSLVAVIGRPRPGLLLAGLTGQMCGLRTQLSGRVETSDAVDPG